MFQPAHLLPVLLTLPGETTLWIAYSGGMDSHVLLHALAVLHEAKLLTHSLHAIHVNHQLSPRASEWETHCANVCKSLQIPFYSRVINAKALPGESPENYARDLRYQAFGDVMSANDYLLTAHHQDDQAETLLLQLFRGAGPKGLASMPTQSDFAKGYHLRPLLTYSRQDLLQYAQNSHLQWIEDESNEELRYDRNFIRRKVMPLLQTRWPALSATLSRAASHCAQANHLLDILAAQDLTTVSTKIPQALSINALASLGSMRMRNVVRYWLRQLDCSMLSEAQMQRLEEDVLHCSIDANPCLRWGEFEITRYRDMLYLMSQQKLTTSVSPIAWDLHASLDLPHLYGKLNILWETGKGLRVLSDEERGKITVRFRKGGELCHPQGRQGSHPLKKLWQEWGVEPWLRDKVPLIFLEDELICVVGYCITEKYAAKPLEKGWFVVLEPSTPSFRSSVHV